MPFFKKNERGYSRFMFHLQRMTIIPTMRYFCSPKIIGREYMPLTGPVFLFGNHSNNFDPFILNHKLTLEPTAGVMTSEYFRKKTSRLFMGSIGIVPTVKYVPDPGVVRDLVRMKDQKRMVVIYPEGGRRWDGQPKPVVESTLKVFYKFGLPVHGVRVHGNYLNWPRWADNPRRNTCLLEFMKPFQASDFNSFESFRDACKVVLNIDDYNPPLECYPLKAKNPAKGIHKLMFRCPISGQSQMINTPDGTTVSSSISDWSFRMDPASRLIDAKGESHSLIDAYKKMCMLPMLSDSDGLMLDQPADVLMEYEYPHLIPKGSGTAKLYTDRVEWMAGSESGSVPISDILYISIEQSRKISLTTREYMLQFIFPVTSPLEWQHYLRRLQAGEQTVLSL
jgi:1-acyl-sn-glycerol-3-phosphate acyltransferase